MKKTRFTDEQMVAILREADRRGGGIRASLSGGMRGDCGNCLRDAGVADPPVSQTAVCDTRAKTPSGTRRRVSYPVSDSMSCIRRARVPVPRRPTPAGAEDTSSRDSLVIVIRCAQRRPERQPRLHVSSVVGARAWLTAQRRPERQPRLHASTANWWASR